MREKCIMEINRNNVIEIIEKSGLKPDKDYGQNYLLETSICERIVDALDINKEDYVLEIGPGLGSLTHFVDLKEVKTDLVDIDQRMIDFLKIIYNKKHINLIRNDIRKHDVSQYTKILGNLPYNITTELVIYLLENAKNCQKMVLMCQSEAFDRFNDVQGKNYGPASILVHLLGTCKKALVVKAGSFYPAPKCSSTVFTLERNHDFDYEKAISVYKLSKQLFLNRRKTIYNNLLSYLGDKEKAIKVLDGLKLPANKRPEELSPSTFVEMFDMLKEN